MENKINMFIKDKKGAYKFKNSNLRFHGMKMDINGNPCFVLSTPNQRAFSVQQPYSITIHCSMKNRKSQESGVEIVEKNIKGYPFKSEEEFESYVIDLAKSRKHVKVYDNNFSCGKGNFGISNNPNYFGDWFGEGQIDYDKVINKNGKGDLYLVKIWSGKGSILDIYLVKAEYIDKAIDMVFEWSYENEGANKIVFDSNYIMERCEEDFKKYPDMFGSDLSDDYEEFEMRYLDDFISSENGYYALADNFFIGKLDGEDKDKGNFSAKDGERKSFYGKAQVDVDDKTGVQTLYSYGTKVAQYNPKTKKFTAYPEAYTSMTTRRHVREFMKQNDVPASDFSILDDTKDVLRAGGKLAGNIVKDTLSNGGILMF